ncbi:MAG: helix-turn-helix transcriptional regulator [Bacteroidales bacterium]|jgi:transcriptional regulator with XRE-family HTH domain|nr:helix-turn-helix transcriptional regulator [Bacteroidales bacterium]
MHYFARNLKYLRREKGLSQEQFAGLVGLNRGNIASYEKQSAEPSIVNLTKIGKFFNIDLNDIIEKDLSLKDDIIDKLEDADLSGNLDEEPVKELFIESLEENQKKIEKFRKRSDEMARILDGFKQFHKFRMENSEKLSDDVKKMALDYEKLLEVLEEVLSTNKHIMQLLDRHE